jgi:hypothetical protein
MTQLCQHGCGHPATYTTKGSLSSGPFKGKPVHQCSKSANSCPAVKERKIQSSRTKYGTDYPWQTKEVLKKRAGTNLEKYGATCSILGKEQQAKRTATMIERYGVEHPTLNEDIRSRAAAGMRAAHANDPSISQQSVLTKREKYGKELAQIADKCRTTQIANGRWVDPARKTEWDRYKFRVKYLTSKNYKTFKELINPENLPIGRCQYQVDHIYSIRHGFENNVDPTVIANINNLRIMWHTANKSKHIRSDITLDRLMAIIREQK